MASIHDWRRWASHRLKKSEDAPADGAKPRGPVALPIRCPHCSAPPPVEPYASTLPAYAELDPAELVMEVDCNTCGLAYPIYAAAFQDAARSVRG